MHFLLAIRNVKLSSIYLSHLLKFTLLILLLPTAFLSQGQSDILSVGNTNHSGQIHFTRFGGGTSGFVGFNGTEEKHEFRISNWSGGSYITFWTNGESGHSEKFRITGDGKAIFSEGLLESPGNMKIFIANTERLRITDYGVRVYGNFYPDGAIIRNEGVGYNQPFDYTLMSFAVNQDARVDNVSTGWKIKALSDENHSPYNAGYTSWAPLRLSFYPAYTTPRDNSHDLNNLRNSILTLYSDFDNGRVGIGTESPESKLDIKNTGTLGARYDPSKAYVKIGDGVIDMLLDGNEIISNEGLFLGSSYSSPIVFRNISADANEDLVTIKPNGNVGIGTTAPTQKLSVSGKINAEEIILEDVAGADFVFEEDYDLRSLAETEKFIKANKHLPEIPSAAEMAEEGLEIKEMNILLLQKVEELTLHLIRQEKTMNDQTKQMQLMQSKLLEQESKIESLLQTQNNE